MNRDDVLLMEKELTDIWLANSKTHTPDDHLHYMRITRIAQARKLLALLNEPCPHYPKIDGKKVTHLQFRKRECPVCIAEIERILKEG